MCVGRPRAAARAAGASALLWAACGDAGGDCWAGDFSFELCCAERWGLTGHTVCWNSEFTYLRCCGLDALPRRAQDDLAWDAHRRSTPTRSAEEEFDFIVVGAGSAGTVLASRLGAAVGPDGRPWRVLLLEEGPERSSEADRADPDRLPEDPARWRQPLTASWQVGDEKRNWTYKTGRGVGGTSGINSMIYMRGSLSEYEAFGWSRAEVLAAFRALEAPMEVPGFEADPTFHRAFSGRRDGEGYHLTLVSARPDELPPLFRALLAAFASAGVPPRLDPHSGPSMHGIGGIWRAMGCDHPRCQPSRVPRFSHTHGRPRSSPAVALLEPVRRRPGQRLALRADTAVERVVFGGEGGRRALGVEVSLGSGERVFYKAAKEVILSAGVFGSPHLLTLSGVGEPKELRRLGIPLVASSPEVGRNLHEHVGLSLVVGTAVQCPDGYHVGEKGGTTHLGNTHEFMGQLYAFFNSTQDEPGAEGPLDAEVMLLEGCVEGFLSLTFTVMLLQTFTRGRIVVQSRNPTTLPHLDYKPLSHSSDIDLLINAIRRLYTKVFASPELEPYDLTVSPPWEVVADIGKLAQYVRSSLWYYSHPGGTCRVHRGEEAPGVVDSQFRVLGTDGLRVVDASVLPTSATGHTDGPARLIGELASRAVLRQWTPDEPEHGFGTGVASDKSVAVPLNGYPGVLMPLCGFGTNGFEGERAVESVSQFLRLGGRMLDTALLYNNHGAIASALRSSEVPREEVFIVSKIPPGKMGLTEAAAAIDRIVAELGTHVDLLLIHWPANFDPQAALPACAAGQPGSWRRCRLDTWRAMEDAHRTGKARALGVSNFGVRHLTELLDAPERTQPVAADEVEFHPWWPQTELLELARRRRVALLAYGSTGGSLMGGAMLRAGSVERVAAARGRSSAQVLLRWAVQQGVAIIPSSSSEAHIAENLDMFFWALTEEDMKLLSAVSKREHMRVYLPDPEGAP